MKKDICSITIITVISAWVFGALLISACGEEQISDSNTNSVENGRRSGRSIEAESAGNYASMDDIKKEVVKVLGKNYWPDKQLTEAELKTETGISGEMIDDYLAEKLNVETDIDAMMIIKAKPEYLEEIEVLLNEYREALMVKYKDRPQELGKVQASRIEVIDRYICFVQLGADTGAAAEKGDEEVLALCQQENERALDRIEKTILNQ